MAVPGMTYQQRLAYRDNGERVSILMPVCDEVEGIEGVIAEAMEVVFRYLPSGSEFLIEEGGSRDGTKEWLRELNLRWPALQVAYKDEREGFARAARNLYSRAQCPLVLFMDSDGQCVPGEFWKLLPHAKESDMVLGVKEVRYDPWLRRTASRVFNACARAIFGFQYRDINFGFRLCRTESLRVCLERCSVMPTLLNAEVAIIAHRLGYRIREVPVRHRPRTFGMSRGLEPGRFWREAVRAFRGLLRLRKKTLAPVPCSLPASEDILSQGEEPPSREDFAAPNY